MENARERRACGRFRLERRGRADCWSALNLPLRAVAPVQILSGLQRNLCFCPGFPPFVGGVLLGSHFWQGGNARAFLGSCSATPGSVLPYLWAVSGSSRWRVVVCRWFGCLILGVGWLDHVGSPCGVTVTCGVRVPCLIWVLEPVGFSNVMLDWVSLRDGCSRSFFPGSPEPGSGFTGGSGSRLRDIS